MALSEQTIQKLKELGRYDLIEVEEINQSGYAGVDRKGKIVDRRENPEAVPVQENKMMGLPAPKKLPNDPYPEFFI